MADEHRMFIAGEWVGSQSGATFEATSPSTGEVIGTLPEGTRDDVRQAVAAGDAFPIWSRLTAFDRARAMRRVAEAIDRRRDEMAHTLALDHGKPMRAEAIDEVEELIACFEMAAADAVRVEGRVRGRFSIERLIELKTIVVHLG
jgi:acyl-CoA reductase-like NAD-dependent aldehyde dehydrogenase